MQPATPFAVPKRLEPQLARVLDHWDMLKRGANDIPFADDLKVCSMPALESQLMLINVFAKPERFRIEYVGDAVAGAAPGQFIDEVALGAPLEYLRAQCSATVEAGAPTWFRHAGPAVGGSPTYSRLLVPLWGDGRISMLLGAVEQTVA